MCFLDVIPYIQGVAQTDTHDTPLNEGTINLTGVGLQRHRVMWIRAMNDEGIRCIVETGPTIDSIQVTEFESLAALKEWLKKTPPAFVP
jgi:hypothetical protein